MELKTIAQSIFDDPSRSFGVELWDGSFLPPASRDSPSGRVILRNPSALHALLPPTNDRRLAEAFIEDKFDLQGDTIGLLEAAARWKGPHLRAALPALVSSWLHRALASSPASLAARVSGRIHSEARDRKAVQHHYDVSNEFYQLFLDSSMVYSCGYFPSGSESLEAAQQNKLELICRKLDLRGGERLLDIGCGWGALLLHANRRLGARALGVTLAKNQLAEARRRLGALSSERVEIRATDYRELSPEEPFDKIASIGMMEHVGRARLDEYFGSVYRLLRPGGLFLNQAIADVAPQTPTLPWLRRSRSSAFVQRYIFPDGEAVPIGLVLQAAERAGFEVRDAESLREHYAQTLAHWVSRLERRFDQAVALVGRARARTWRLYLASFAASFRLGRLSVFQLLLAKRLANGRAVGLPRDRARWYDDLRPLPDEERPDVREPTEDSDRSPEVDRTQLHAPPP